MTEVKREPLDPFINPNDIEDTIEALKSVRSAWLRDPAVVAVDVGYRLIDGKPATGNCYIFFGEREDRKVRLSTKEIADLCEVSEQEVRESVTTRLSDKLADANPVNYKKPWIRVHVDRRLTQSQVEKLGRNAYHEGLEIGEKRFEVDVVDAMYKPLGDSDGPVTHKELDDRLSKVNQQWEDLQKAWLVREEALIERLKKEERNRRGADARDRSEASQERDQ